MKIQNSKLKTKNYSGGQSLFELVVAIAISALIIVVLVSLVASSIRNATFSKNNAQASSYAQAATEWLRSERDNDANTFFSTKAITGTTYCLDSLSWNTSGQCVGNEFIPGTPFIREVSFPGCSSCSNSLVEADVKVSWADSQGVHEVISATSFADWRQR